MPKLDYLMRVASGMSLEKLRQCVNDAHERSGKPKALLLADIIHCARKFGAGYYDYLIFEFYNMTDEERATYMTRMRNKRFDDMINDPEDCAIFDDKSQFYAHFSDFMGRDWRDLAKVSDEVASAATASRRSILPTSPHSTRRLPTCANPRRTLAWWRTCSSSIPRCRACIPTR